MSCPVPAPPGGPVPEKPASGKQRGGPGAENPSGVGGRQTHHHATLAAIDKDVRLHGRQFRGESSAFSIRTWPGKGNAGAGGDERCGENLSQEVERMSPAAKGLRPLKTRYDFRELLS